MNIYYRNSPTFLENDSQVIWLAGTLINGNTSIQNPDSTFVSVQPNGTIETRTAIGPWELCSLNPNNNTVTFSATGIAYPIPIKGR